MGFFRPCWPLRWVPLFERSSNNQAAIQDVLDEILVELDLELFRFRREELRIVDVDNFLPPRAEEVEHSLTQMAGKWSVNRRPQCIPVNASAHLISVVSMYVGVSGQQLGSFDPNCAGADRLDFNQFGSRRKYNVAVGAPLQHVLGVFEGNLGIFEQFSLGPTFAAPFRARCPSPVTTDQA